MELHRVQITNFRSIKDLTIYFSPRCRVLVGINESGKTNILRALSMLNEDQVPTDDDKRDPLPDEPPVTESYIRFIFKLDKLERQKVFEKIKDNFIAKNIKKPMLTYKAQEMTLQKFCDELTEGVYRVNILSPKNKKEAVYRKLSTGYKVHDTWKKPSAACPPTYTLALPDSNNAISISKHIIDVEDCPDIPANYLTDVTPEDINEMVGSQIVNIVNDGLLDCIYWVYSEKNLLPGKIELSGFISNPTSCLPLKHMFELAGISDIAKAITEEQKRPNGLRNLLKRVADRTTKHIRNVWKEYKDIKIILSENGPHIDAAIEDKFNVYNFARRSDGFKRFVTFLLMISAKERTKQLRDTLLLIDEPDIGLHPSGARYLRDELIKISETNHVVYSTHSIFMVDRENTERHLIVKKENEETSAENVSQSNIKDEEVIYNALGHSIFEDLAKKNIVFEGWRDKQLFRIAIKTPPSKYKSLKDDFSGIGTCHAVGIKDIPRVSTILELADRECMIVSDDDNIAKQYQKEYDGHGRWCRYSEILENTKALTGEDFIKPEVFEPIFKKLMQKYPLLSELSEGQLHDSGGKLYVIDEWLKKGGIGQQEKKAVLNEIKGEIFNNLKASHVEEEYFEFLKKLAKLL
ncbi:MAG: ATP-binding protein [Nitrospirae bacterium]|nr:ATP-binding protein [Nitrospirota bacterium]